MKPRKIVEEFPAYDYPANSRKDFLRLDLAENLKGCSPKVIDRLINITADDISIYPEYDARAKVAKSLKTRPENIILTNGSDDAIRLIMEAYLKKDDEIILMDPSFAMFEFYAKLREARILKVLLNENLTFPKKRFLDSITTKTKMVVLCNPNNPTGTIINRKIIINILEKTKGLVLLDEAYFDFFGESAIELIDNYSNLIIIRTFSKQAGLAGIRIGIAIANEDRISTLMNIASPYAVNSLACIALDAALDDWKFVTDYIDEIKISKEYLFNELEKLGIKTYQTGANFFIANFGGDVKKICVLLRLKGILIRDRSSLPLLSGCARITIGTLEQSQIFISAIKDILRLVNLDTLLFDMDGVLVDVSNSYRLAIKKTVRFFSEKEITFEQIQSYKEKGGLNNDWDCVQAILKDCGIKKTREEIVQKFDEFYLGGIIDNETLIVKKQLLDTLSKKFKLAIITGRPKRDAYYTVKKFGLDLFFKVILTMDDVENKAKGIKKSLSILKANNAVYLGDTVDDMVSSKDADIPSIGIIPPSPSSNIKTLLQKKGACIVLDNINQLEVLL